LSEPLICALLSGKAEKAEYAEKAARHFMTCPYVYFMATHGAEVHATLFLPTQQRWWIEYVEKDPQGTLGLKTARVTFVDSIQYPSRMAMRVPKTPQQTAPCGANCATCGAYSNCLGCPSTRFYKGQRTS
jgi:hypothetical protein